ncbi:retinol dehydrogenase 8-like [Amphiura filiformis]|uniref:retinol dehydrogenase 8-like n=1 Tax=Amphiura filiformis TaxID=82378 RepID=UPI003B20B782
MASQVVLITGCAQGIGKEVALTLARDPQRRFKVYATMRNLVKRQTLDSKMASHVVLITGCAQGIGKEVALTLARDPQRRFKNELKTEAGSNLDDTLFIRELDVTKQDTIDKTVKEIIDNEGKIDVLVNNAGVTSGDWWETGPMQTFYDIMEVNYFGSVRMTKTVVPYMKEKIGVAKFSNSQVYLDFMLQDNRSMQRYIAELGTLDEVLDERTDIRYIYTTFSAVPVAAQYTASKFALEGFSESIAPPLRKFNVWVSVIEPGFVATDMVQQFGDNPTALWVGHADEIPGEEDRKIVTDLVSFDPKIVSGDEMQETQEVAKLIQDVILSPKPDCRYQTSETIKRLATERFIDPTGNAIMNNWLKA